MQIDHLSAVIERPRGMLTSPVSHYASVVPWYVRLCPSPAIISISSSVSAPDCRLEVDIILVSSDDHAFGGHIINLATCSEGFSPAGPSKMTKSGSPSEIEEIKYAEDGKTLGLLLRFMHSMETPSLDELEFGELKAFVMAVHKYNVYHAKAYCMLLMKYGCLFDFH